MFVAVPVSEYCLAIEPRRSKRLQDNRYYRPDGSSVICYKETPYKIFNKRRKKSHGETRSMNSEGEEEHDPLEESEGEEDHNPLENWTSRRTLLRTVMFLIQCMVPLTLLVLSAACVILGHMYYTSEEAYYSRLLSKGADLRHNFATRDDGAVVIAGLSSETHRPQSWINWFYMWWCPKLQIMLQPGSPLVPGMCWPMAGDRGHVTIQLSKAARVSHITIGHITKFQSPIRDTPSAPRDMTIYGLNLMSGEEKLLGSFTYDQTGPSFQTFAVPRVHPETFQHVRIHVDSNYGNKDYTCLYNIRVHGEAGPETTTDKDYRLGLRVLGFKVGSGWWAE